MKTLIFRPVFAALFLTLFITGCDSDDSHEHDPIEELANAVREATQQFTSSSAAAAAGYVDDEHCVVHPELGAMGVHWVNQPLTDPEFDALKPEVLLYEPQANGSNLLIGVEYVVIDVGQERPDFAGHSFDVGGVPPLEAAGVDHWSLHVWLFKDNPSGLFAPFNPAVTCEHADDGGHDH